MWQPELEAAAPEQVRVIQGERLGTLIRRLWPIPFYRDSLRAAGLRPGAPVSLYDLPGLPMITKADLRAQYPFGLLGVRREQIARIHATSGTGGKPTVVSYTAEDLQTWSDICARMLVAAGCRPGDTWYVASGYGLFTGGMGAHYGLERVGAAVVPASSGNTNRLLQLFGDIPPVGIHCIPSYMLRLAEVAQEEGKDPRSFGLRYGSFGGETWSEPLRQRIQKLFGLVACDVYGLSECFGPGVGYECSHQDGLHLSEDHFLAEIVDPQTGRPVPEGELGELLLTTLTKRAMPLLRYRTGDLTRFLPGRCGCGRRMRRIERIRGRCDEMLIVRGVNLYPAEVERVLLQIPEVSEQYRLVLDRPGAMDQLTLEIELATPPGGNLRGLRESSPAGDRRPEEGALADRIQAQIKRELGVSATVRLLAPGTLPRAEGKAKRVLDLRKPQ